MSHGSLKWNAAALAALVLSFAAPPAALAGGDSLAAARPKALVGVAATTSADLTMTAWNADGEEWADTTLHMVAVIYDLGGGEYGAEVSVSGTFTSRAAGSPNGTGTIEAGVTGTVLGGLALTFSGPPLPVIPEYLGSFTDEDNLVDLILDGLADFELVSYDSEWVAFVTCDGRAAFQAFPWDAWGDITGGPAACESSLQLAFDGLYAFINPGYVAPAGTDVGAISPRDVCYVISNVGRPSQARMAAICDTQWPGGPRPGWSAGATLLASGPVYKNGTAKGYWAGDPVVDAFSPNSARLPLNSTDGAWSYLYKEHCHHMSNIGEPHTWCN